MHDIAEWDDKINFTAKASSLVPYNIKYGCRKARLVCTNYINKSALTKMIWRHIT